MNYTQLTLDERYTIYEEKQRGLTLTQIAAELGRSKATISRELRRNCSQRGYRPHYAHKTMMQRQGVRRGGRRVEGPTWTACRKLLVAGHSPEQAAGRCRREGLGTVSHEYLYRRIYADKAKGGGLWRYLRCQKMRRKRYGSGRQKRGRIPNRTGIEARCPRVESRSIVGHWEGDTVVGRNHKGFLVTLVERRSGLGLVQRVRSKSAGVVSSAIIEMLKPYHQMVRTLTFDNGLEFAGHAKVASSLDCKVYFARPYASWQRGSNENYNGLLRQYFPKRSCFASLTEGQVAAVQRLINERARKRLDWASPAELFGQAGKRLGVALAC